MRYAEPSDHGYLAESITDAHHAAIIARLLMDAGLRRGDRVVEIGAGCGRYTQLLVDQGLRVVATEPDPFLHHQLQRRFANEPAVTVECRGVEQIDAASLGQCRGIVGFHVLHHLDTPALAHLQRLLEHAQGQEELCAAFLEPNPLNPLYAIQIALHPGMRFREERGLWARYCGPGSPCPSLKPCRHLGLVPPAISRRLALAKLPPIASPIWSPWSCYRGIVRRSSGVA